MMDYPLLGWSFRVSNVRFSAVWLLTEKSPFSDDIQRIELFMKGLTPYHDSRKSVKCK